MEINGFEIEKRNIHNLNEGAKVSTCPLCSSTRKKKTDKCMKLNWSLGLGHCFHCGETVQLHTFKKKTVESKVYTKPTWTNKTSLSENLIKYIEGRGISQTVCKIMKIGEGVESMPDKKTGAWISKNTVQFPYFYQGEIINIKYRSGDKNFKMFKGAEKIPYNIDMVAGCDEVYWVEGEWDALSLIEIGIHNVVSVPNGFTDKGEVNLDWLNDYIHWFDETKKHILCFDNDKAGINGKDEFVRRFGSHKCFLVDFKDCKDSNEYLVKYGKVALRTVLDNIIEIPLTEITTIRSHYDELKDFFLNGMPKGYQIGLNGFDEKFSVELGQYVVVTGIPSYGKSEFVDQMIAGYALKYGFSIGMCSVENRPTKLHSAKLVRKIIGKTPKIFDNEYENVIEFISTHVYNIEFLDYYDLDRVLLKCEELIYRKGIRILVIDPYNKVRLKESLSKGINEYTNDYLLKIDLFCRKHNIIIILVAHPVKLEKDKNTKKRDMPDFYDIKGGGEFYDMSPHGLCIHRDFEKKITSVKVLKCKFSHLGENGALINLGYNMYNGRLSEAFLSSDTGEYEYNKENDNWLIKFDKQPQQEEIKFENNELDWYSEPKEQAPF
jgi:twinkle protein